MRQGDTYGGEGAAGLGSRERRLGRCHDEGASRCSWDY